ncbi:hypothetical protein CYMTET_47780 [Cymbomonas tetramitiformis]|uniref:STOP2/WIP2-like C2H2-type zinc finger domain-containing protein n=1 Tax=Cymbomonas tetramitiformis TaxID=36881 RepID=A0AAE0BTH9_9CHLO|nr:hypothetical protein CYMTET_47780 [Cymbomonas tetramitiformis]
MALGLPNRSISSVNEHLSEPEVIEVSLDYANDTIRIPHRKVVQSNLLFRLFLLAFLRLVLVHPQAWSILITSQLFELFRMNADGTLRLEGSKRYSCPVRGCKRNSQHADFASLKTPQCVRHHFRRAHTTKPSACRHCDRKFGLRADLVYHEKSCGQAQRRWECACGTSYARKDHFKRHMAAHNKPGHWLRTHEGSGGGSGGSDLELETRHLEPLQPSCSEFSTSAGPEAISILASTRPSPSVPFPEWPRRVAYIPPEAIADTNAAAAKAAQAAAARVASHMSASPAFSEQLAHGTVERRTLPLPRTFPPRPPASPSTPTIPSTHPSSVLQELPMSPCIALPEAGSPARSASPDVLDAHIAMMPSLPTPSSSASHSSQAAQLQLMHSSGQPLTTFHWQAPPPPPHATPTERPLGGGARSAAHPASPLTGRLATGSSLGALSGLADGSTGLGAQYGGRHSASPVPCLSSLPTSSIPHQPDGALPPMPQPIEPGTTSATSSNLVSLPLPAPSHPLQACLHRQSHPGSPHALQWPPTAESPEPSASAGLLPAALPAFLSALPLLSSRSSTPSPPPSTSKVARSCHVAATQLPAFVSFLPPGIGGGADTPACFVSSPAPELHATSSGASFSRGPQQDPAPAIPPSATQPTRPNEIPSYGHLPSAVALPVQPRHQPTSGFDKALQQRSCRPYSGGWLADEPEANNILALPPRQVARKQLTPRGSSGQLASMCPLPHQPSSPGCTASGSTRWSLPTCELQAELLEADDARLTPLHTADVALQSEDCESPPLQMPSVLGAADISPLAFETSAADLAPDSAICLGYTAPLQPPICGLTDAALPIRSHANTSTFTSVHEADRSDTITATARTMRPLLLRPR